MATTTKAEDEESMVSKDRARLQSHGFLTSAGHWNANINACAVPFWPDPPQEPVAFLCGANNDTMTKARLRNSVGPLLLKSVRQLERSLGISNLRPA